MARSVAGSAISVRLGDAPGPRVVVVVAPACADAAVADAPPCAVGERPSRRVSVAHEVSFSESGRRTAAEADTDASAADGIAPNTVALEPPMTASRRHLSIVDTFSWETTRKPDRMVNGSSSLRVGSDGGCDPAVTAPPTAGCYVPQPVLDFEVSLTFDAATYDHNASDPTKCNGGSGCGVLSQSPSAGPDGVTCKNAGNGPGYVSGGACVWTVTSGGATANYTSGSELTQGTVIVLKCTGVQVDHNVANWDYPSANSDYVASANFDEFISVHPYVQVNIQWTDSAGDNFDTLCVPFEYATPLTESPCFPKSGCLEADGVTLTCNDVVSPGTCGDTNLAEALTVLFQPAPDTTVGLDWRDAKWEEIRSGTGTIDPNTGEYDDLTQVSDVLPGSTLLVLGDNFAVYPGDSVSARTFSPDDLQPGSIAMPPVRVFFTRDYSPTIGYAAWATPNAEEVIAGLDKVLTYESPRVIYYSGAFCSRDFAARLRVTSGTGSIERVVDQCSALLVEVPDATGTGLRIHFLTAAGLSSFPFVELDFSAPTITSVERISLARNPVLVITGNGFGNAGTPYDQDCDATAAPGSCGSNALITVRDTTRQLEYYCAPIGCDTIPGWDSGWTNVNPPNPLVTWKITYCSAAPAFGGCKDIDSNVYSGIDCVQGVIRCQVYGDSATFPPPSGAGNGIDDGTVLSGSTFEVKVSIQGVESAAFTVGGACPVVDYVYDFSRGIREANGDFSPPPSGTEDSVVDDDFLLSNLLACEDDVCPSGPSGQWVLVVGRNFGERDSSPPKVRFLDGFVKVTDPVTGNVAYDYTTPGSGTSDLRGWDSPVVKWASRGANDVPGSQTGNPVSGDFCHPYWKDDSLPPDNNDFPKVLKDTTYSFNGMTVPVRPAHIRTACTRNGGSNPSTYGAVLAKVPAGYNLPSVAELAYGRPVAVVLGSSGGEIDSLSCPDFSYVINGPAEYGVTHAKAGLFTYPNPVVMSTTVPDTNGQDETAISGRNFGPSSSTDLAVYITNARGTKLACSNPVVTKENTEIQCTAPPGAGRALTLDVLRGTEPTPALSSFSFPGFAYAVPEVPGIDSIKCYPPIATGESRAGKPDFAADLEADGRRCKADDWVVVTGRNFGNQPTETVITIFDGNTGIPVVSGIALTPNCLVDTGRSCSSNLIIFRMPVLSGQRRGVEVVTLAKTGAFAIHSQTSGRSSSSYLSYYAPQITFVNSPPTQGGLLRVEGTYLGRQNSFVLVLVGRYPASAGTNPPESAWVRTSSCIARVVEVDDQTGEGTVAECEFPPGVGGDLDLRLYTPHLGTGLSPLQSAQVVILSGGFRVAPPFLTAVLGAEQILDEETAGGQASDDTADPDTYPDEIISGYARPGEVVTLRGFSFGSNPDDITVMIGEGPLRVQGSTSDLCPDELFNLATSKCYDPDPPAAAPPSDSPTPAPTNSTEIKTASPTPTSTVEARRLASTGSDLLGWWARGLADDPKELPADPLDPEAFPDRACTNIRMVVEHEQITCQTSALSRGRSLVVTIAVGGQRMDPSPTTPRLNFRLRGCNKPAACNYDPDATEDDSSCIIIGCPDSRAINYAGEAASRVIDSCPSGCVFPDVELRLKVNVPFAILSPDNDVALLPEPDAPTEPTAAPTNSAAVDPTPTPTNSTESVPAPSPTANESATSTRRRSAAELRTDTILMENVERIRTMVAINAQVPKSRVKFNRLEQANDGLGIFVVRVTDTSAYERREGGPLEGMRSAAEANATFAARIYRGNLVEDPELPLLSAVTLTRGNPEVQESYTSRGLPYAPIAEDDATGAVTLEVRTALGENRISIWNYVALGVGGVALVLVSIYMRAILVCCGVGRPRRTKPGPGGKRKGSVAPSEDGIDRGAETVEAVVRGNVYEHDVALDLGG